MPATEMKLTQMEQNAEIVGGKRVMEDYKWHGESVFRYLKQFDKFIHRSEQNCGNWHFGLQSFVRVNVSTLLQSETSVFKLFASV